MRGDAGGKQLPRPGTGVGKWPDQRGGKTPYRRVPKLAGSRGEHLSSHCCLWFPPFSYNSPRSIQLCFLLFPSSGAWRVTGHTYCHQLNSPDFVFFLLLLGLPSHYFLDSWEKTEVGRTGWRSPAYPPAESRANFQAGSGCSGSFPDEV